MKAHFFKEIPFSVEGLKFNSKDGIVLKNYSFQDSYVHKFTFKKIDEVPLMVIENAVIDVAFFLSLLSQTEVKDLTLYPLEIWLKDIQLKLNGKNLFKIMNGFVLFDKNGLNLILDTSLQFLPFEFQGYFSNNSRESYFTLNSSFLPLALLGVYNFNTGELKSKFYWHKIPYYFQTNIIFEAGSVVLKDTQIEKLILPGPLNLNLEDKIFSNWSIESPKYKAQGSFSLKKDKDIISLYIKVIDAYIGGYKLITNFYLDYLKHPKFIKFNSLGTVLNNRPLPELELSLRLLDDGLLLENFRYEGGLVGSGCFDYHANFNLRFKFDDFSFQELLNIILPIYARNLDLQNLNGELSFFSYNGVELLEMMLKLSAGRIQDINFQQGKIHLIGNARILEFLNSELLVDGKPMALQGQLDISKFPESEMWKDVYLVCLAPTLLWQEINFEERFRKRSLSLGTKPKENIKLDYSVEFSEEENYNKDEVSLEIKGKPNWKLRLRRDEEIMSIQKSIKF